MLYIRMAGPCFVSDDSFLSPRDEVSGLAVISSLLVGSYLQMCCYCKHIFVITLQLQPQQLKHGAILRCCQICAFYRLRQRGSSEEQSLSSAVQVILNLCRCDPGFTEPGRPCD